MIRNPKIRNSKFEIRNLCIIILMIVGVLVWVLRCGDVVTAGTYTDSGHGDTTDGVNRPRTTGYSVGNCAHCHEQHASIGGTEITPQKFELFYSPWVTKCDHICYRCHSGNSGVEMQLWNYPYAYNFGGRPDTFAGTIYKQFCADYAQYINCGSRHHLGAIGTLIDNNAYGWGYPAEFNICSACHNPHLAQRFGSVRVNPPYDPSKSTITRPSEHYNNPLNLWGDEASERMNQYAASVGGHYLAPYYGSPGNPTTGPFEPANNSTSDGSNLPDYVTLCMDCHQYDLPADPERSGEGPVYAIDWSSSGDKHGGRASGDCSCGGMWEQGNLRSPYSDSQKEAGYNYVLSCTDCHEPHGTKNRLHLIRTFVNGEGVAAETVTCNSDDDYKALCGRCHTSIHSMGGCSTCHKHGSDAGWCDCVSDRTF